MHRRLFASFSSLSFFFIACLVWVWFPFLRDSYYDVSQKYYGSGTIEDYEGKQYIFKGPQAEDKVIVVATVYGEDVSWIQEELPDWQQAIYHMNAFALTVSPLHPPVNRGREAMAYLTFIIDHYSILPEIMVFVHPHRKGWPKAWHTDAQDYDNVNAIQGLRLDYIREQGYANMRCIQDPGCPAEIQPFRHLSQPSTEPGPGKETLQTSAPAEDANTKPHEVAFADAYMYMFQVANSSVPHTVAAACCSQFAVSRSQVLKRPKEDYLRYQSWLMKTSLTSQFSGRVMEYMWHIIFGKSPVWCPDVVECWCDTYGRMCSNPQRMKKRF